jgi:hypothetical protein
MLAHLRPERAYADRGANYALRLLEYIQKTGTPLHKINEENIAEAAGLLATAYDPDTWSIPLEEKILQDAANYLAGESHIETQKLLDIITFHVLA